MNIKKYNQEQFLELFTNIIDQKINKSEVKKILLEINEIGYSKEVFIGSALALKKKMRSIKAPINTIDVCGTGGDNLNSLNISTAVSFVAASCGVNIAKHGNKAISSRSGSADIFAELQIPILSNINEIEISLERNKLVFLFAPLFHDSLKNLSDIRKEIASEFSSATIFNFLGPLLNPANVKKQFIGTSRKDTMLPMIEALNFMGSDSVYIVNGFDGMDEISICENSYLLKLKNKKISEIEVINPEKYSFKKVSIDEIKGLDPKYNSIKLHDLLKGEKSAYRDIVILNTAFVLELSGFSKNITEGIKQAKFAIDSGSSYRLLKKLSS